MREKVSQINTKTGTDETNDNEKYPSLKRITSEQLEEIIGRHQMWVESGKSKGEQAKLIKINLSGVDLQGANLTEAVFYESEFTKANLAGANLSKTNLSKSNLLEAKLFDANLTEADLSGANLSCADLSHAVLFKANLSDAILVETNLNMAFLREANFKKAVLQDANLKNTDLQDVNLMDVKGLSASQLSGANVCGAKMPNDINTFEGLLNIEKASRHAMKLFVSLLLGCFYSWLTILMTTDALLITNSASSPLPIIGTEIPIVSFYLLAPFILLGIYVYFHLYMQRLWERLSQLPAVFPDGQTLDERVYPWLLNGIVRAYFVRLKDDTPALFLLQKVTTIYLSWSLVPFTFLIFWIRYFSRHDWVITSIHIVLFTVSIWLSCSLFAIARSTLCGQKRTLKDLITLKQSIATLAIGIIIYLFSLGAINGIPDYFNSINADQKSIDIRRLVPVIFSFFGYSPFADLRGIDLSVKPDNWTGKEFPLVKGIDLKNRNLRYALAYGTFLAKANINGADFYGAKLDNANLNGVVVQRPEDTSSKSPVFDEATLVGADLRDTSFWGASFKMANLMAADLQNATLIAANFYKAQLVYTNFSNSLLQEADLRSALMGGTKFTNADLRQANLENADLSKFEDGLRRIIIVDLNNADLRGTNLKKTDLKGASIQGAKFHNAILDGADLREANLTDSEGLTQDQIDVACVDHTTKLPKYLELRKPCTIK